MDFRDCRVRVEIRKCSPNDGADVIARGPFGVAMIWSFEPASEKGTVVKAPPNVFTAEQIEQMLIDIREGLDKIGA